MSDTLFDSDTMYDDYVADERDHIDAEARNEFAQVAQDTFGQTTWNGIPVYWSDALSCYVTIPE